MSLQQPLTSLTLTEANGASIVLIATTLAANCSLTSVSEGNKGAIYCICTLYVECVGKLQNIPSLYIKVHFIRHTCTILKLKFMMPITYSFLQFILLVIGQKKKIPIIVKVLNIRSIRVCACVREPSGTGYQQNPETRPPLPASLVTVDHFLSLTSLQVTNSAVLSA